MFEKIPSLKDFIIYVIPGMITCYFGLNIINKISKLTDPLTSETISKSSVLTIIGVIFSFVVGFIVSQLQILAYNFVLRRINIRLRTIQGTSLNDEIKEKISTQVIKTFTLHTTKDLILVDKEVLYLCLNYVKIYSTEESLISINRTGNLSSFASALPIPTLFGLLNLLLELNTPTKWIILILIATSILLLIFLTKIILNFRKEWINNIYRQFLILTIKNKDSY